MPEKGPVGGVPQVSLHDGAFLSSSVVPLFCKLGCISLLEPFAEGGKDV